MCELPWFSEFPLPHLSCPPPPHHGLAPRGRNPETPAPRAAATLPPPHTPTPALFGILQAPSRHRKSERESHLLQSRSPLGHRGAGTSPGLSWWRGWGSRQRLCKGGRSQLEVEAEERKGGPAGLPQFAAGIPRSPAGRARADQAPQVQPSVPTGGSGVRAPTGGCTGTGSGDSGSAAAAEPGPPGPPGPRELGEGKPAGPALRN